MVATENYAARSPRASVEPPPESEKEMSRNEIAAHLGSKDPTWFRQTQDRGAGSAAYRRNQDEVMSDTKSSHGSIRLAGMSRTSATDHEKDIGPAAESGQPQSLSRESSIPGYSERGTNHPNSASLSSTSGFRSPVPIVESQILEPPSTSGSRQGSDVPASRAMAMSPSQGRISPERLDRASSPTKGLGGFVQSAMLKRSDSVTKRWSAQPGVSLSRSNSIASNRSGYDNSRRARSNMSPPREQQGAISSRDDMSRPGSSQSMAATTQKKSDSESNYPGNAPIPTFKERASTPPSQFHTQTTYSDNRDDSAKQSPPPSPGKKWSPTKSSWLENAINKPESPRPKVASFHQPPWKANTNQTKQQRGGHDAGKSIGFKEVTPGGLLRSPPMGAGVKPPNIAGIPAHFGVSSGHTPGLAHETAPQALDSPTSQSYATPGSKPGVLRTQSPVAQIEKPTEPENPPTDFQTLKLEAPLLVKNGNAPLSASSTPSEPPAPPKPKPETPPKKDFRANLKSRRTSSEKKEADDLEFKSVFGKLKRTQTQNYVAPDELKDNILRGKAGLTVTGGPKKSERKDEFKESILKKKEAMKAGTSDAGVQKTSRNVATPDNDSPLPEALAKQRGLTRFDTSLTPKELSTNKTATLEALTKSQDLQGKPSFMPLEKGLDTHAKSQKQPDISSKLGGGFSSSLADKLARGPPAPINGMKTGSAKVSEVASIKAGTSGALALDEPPNSGQLVHMTKARAKGPKRRLPTSNQSTSNQTLPLAKPKPLDNHTKTQRQTGPASNIKNPTTLIERAPTRPLTNITDNNRRPSQADPFQKLSIDQTKALNGDPQGTRDVNVKFASSQPASSLNGRKRSSSVTVQKPPKPSLIEHQKPTTSAKPSVEQQKPQSPPGTVESPVSQVAESGVEDRFPAIEGVTAEQAQNQPQSSLMRVKSPIKLSTLANQEEFVEDPSSLSKGHTESVGLGINPDTPTPQTLSTQGEELPASNQKPPMSPKSPPPLGKKPRHMANRVVSNTPPMKSMPKQEMSPVPRSSEAAQIFSELFDEVPHSAFKVNIDTEAIIRSRKPHCDPDKIKTLRKQIWEVSSGGKLLPVPSHQEHILFEESMYICTHVFGSLTGSRSTETYLWCGDGVSTSAVEDAQLFARKVAKDHNGKLIILKQGKETSRFFQALGGIVILRRGASDRPHSAYILCGRRHVGQIAFDEVDFSPSSLCQGFPYILCAPPGKVYLWHGSGSGADELGCARLIGNDLGSTADIEEVDEGKEPEKFWSCFPHGQQRSGTTDEVTVYSKHWHLKPSCEKYATRLYQVDIEPPRPKSSSSGFKWVRRGSAPASEENSGPSTAQIREISPFAQSDVWDDGVFVLDGFFEIFVFVIPPPFFPLLRSAS